MGICFNVGQLCSILLFKSASPFSWVILPFHWKSNSSCRLSDDLIRLSVGVPPSGGVDDDHRRVGCVKPEGGQTLLTRLRPNKMSLMQTALTQPHTVAIPQQNFDTITGRVAKDKGRSFTGLLPEGLRYLRREAIYSSAEVNSCCA